MISTQRGFNFPRRAIASMLRGNEIVVDLFAGGGSTGRAAAIEQFDAILMEIDPEYVEIAKRRVGGDAPLFTEVA